MIIDLEELKRIILNLGSLSGLVALPYTIAQAAKRRPRLKFDFSAASRDEVRKSDSAIRYCRFEFSGVIKNQSLETNSISKVYLVVWKDNRRGILC